MTGPTTGDTLPIADHGLIGDLRTAALVGTDGTIDWFCPGRFDASSVFASVLDTEVGGSWRLEPVDGSVRTQQFYVPNTAILATRFLTTDGVVEVYDFMPVLERADADHRQRIVRRVTAVRGSTRVRSVVSARPDYARATPELEADGDGIVLTDASQDEGGLRMGLVSTTELSIAGDDVIAEIDLATGESAVFVLEVLGSDASPQACTLDEVGELIVSTSAFWHDWVEHSTYTGRWRETVNRSAITLKLLTHEPTGAIIAAPTTSLPEAIGGGRNWDYRYVWVRDAGFSLYALLRLGFTEEAQAFVRWLSERMGEGHDEQHLDANGDDLGPLRVLYDIDGNAPVDEHELDHLSGYRDSAPVRVGNGAVDQLQLDIYGEIIDSVYLFNKYGPGLSHDAWRDMQRVIDWLTENWEREDAGMWEVRGGYRPHTTSRLMAWVAFERMIRMARQRGLPGDITAWSDTRDRIYARIMDESWSEELQAFTQVEGGSALDAGVLLMPMVKFLSPADPRFLSTLEAIESELVADSLVFRYDVSDSPDGVDDDSGTEEGTFSLCSFWYVEALTRAGRLDEASVALEKMFTYANHLGLYAEQVGDTGDQLGNFPQAFTHLSLISAAINLDRALG